jgi:transcriptional regulator with XRE-family HTH domain
MQKWWKGDVEPTLQNRRLVVKALGVPLQELLSEDMESAKAESDRAIEQYIAGPMGADLTPEQCDQLRMSILWITANEKTPMEPREVHAAAELIRLRMRSDSSRPPPLNPRGSPKGRKLKR